MDMSNSVTAEAVRSNRARLGMSLAELAERVGMSVAVVAEWESGTKRIPSGKMDVLREVLEMDDSKSEFGHAALLRQIGMLAKQRREELGLGRVVFARETGVGSDATIRDLEFGRRVPMGTTQRKIEKGLGWRFGVIEDVLRMVDRKATSITMEELDAEDSLRVGHDIPGMRPLAFASTDELLGELRRRLEGGVPFQKTEVPAQDQELYGLAASTNAEHLEDED